MELTGYLEEGDTCEEKGWEKEGAWEEENCTKFGLV